jgi:hypothetical protein
MALFPKEELDQAFWAYHDALNKSARNADWGDWGSRLTPDATFVETQLGRLGKREAIVRAVSKVMQQTGESPWLYLNRFPVEDYVLDDNRGWVWSLWWARFEDPGDGSIHQARAFLLLKYKGDGLFFYGETIYNPFHLQRAMDSWKQAKALWNVQAEERLAILAAREKEAREMAPLKL